MGFSYNGVHSDDMMVEFAPGPDFRWFGDPEFENYESDVGFHHGGYFYGSKVKSRTFVLKCYFEEITQRQREGIRRWLKRGTEGRLVFDDKPFVYWNVRPGKTVPGQMYYSGDLYSGTFEITFTADDPFGYLTRKYNTGSETDDAEDYCDLIDQGQMPAAPTTSGTSFNVYNPGTEPCGLVLRLSGSTSNPIMFQNDENATRCILSDLPSNNLILEVDGDHGVCKTYISAMATEGEISFAYHDRGYVRLEPGMNTIYILEQNASGNWGARSSLSLNSISVDYQPRLL